MAIECIFDFETRSPEPISYGTDRYTTKSEPLLLTWGLLDTELALDHSKQYQSVELHDWTQTDDPQLPREFEYILQQKDVPLVAHNAPFDRAQFLGPLRLWTPYLPVTRFRCTRAQAYAHGLPGALEALPGVLGLPPETAKFADDGHRLIQLFCVPRAVDKQTGAPLWHSRHTHPAEWLEFCNYAKQDTRSLRAVRRALPRINYEGEHLETWWLDQMINNRGFGFDSELAEAARRLLDASKAELRRDVGDATGGAVESPTQRTRLLAWLEAKGFEVPNLRAATIREMLDADDLDPMVRFVLESRLEAAKASGAKYGRGLSMQVGGRLRHTIQFSGAGRSGRFSHKGFQPGNMARPVSNGAGKKAGTTVPVPAEFCLDVLVPGILRGDVLKNPMLYDRPHTACANALRCAIIAAPGNELIDRDYSGIEARGAAWLAEEGWLLDAYHAQDRGEGADSYKQLVSRFFGIPIEEVDNHLRQVGKVVRLSFQYGAGVGGLVTMAANYNMDLDALVPIILPRATPEQLKKAAKMWRKAFFAGLDFGLAPDTYRVCDVLKQMYREAEKRVTQVRYDIDEAVGNAMENPGQPFKAARSTFFRTSSNLTIVLPSGRRLLYWRPEYILTREVDPETLEEKKRTVLTFMTPRGKSWVREKTWNGLFFNNIDQGMCADILRNGMKAIHRDTLTVAAVARYLHTLPPEQRTAIVLHVHDAVTLDVPVGSYDPERMDHCMVSASPWAKGFPLATDGWVGPRYHYK
jgi:DNA polymerase